MKVWAITGGIACGKSTVARLFAEHGATTRDADADAREARADPEVRARILATFGTIEPGELAAKIYSDPDARKKLNGIVHPEVRKRMRAAIDAARSSSESGLLLYEVPLLFEGGLETWFDGVICAFCSPETQRARLKARHPQLTDDEIERRISSQMRLDEKITHSDIVIVTGVSFEFTRAQVRDCWRQLST